MSAGVAAQYCHLRVISSTRRRTVINEETFDWNAVLLRKLSNCQLKILKFSGLKFLFRNEKKNPSTAESNLRMYTEMGQ